MPREFAIQIIDDAHRAFINGHYEDAVTICKSIKIRLQDSKLLHEAMEFERTKDESFSKEYSEKGKAWNANAFERQSNCVDMYTQYARDYIRFYDGIIKRGDTI